MPAGHGTPDLTGRGYTPPPGFFVVSIKGAEENMKGTTGFRLAIAALLLALLGSPGVIASQDEPGVQGGAPMLVSYQGQVLVSGNPFIGTGYFKFAVVNLAGDTTYWSNDGSSTGGGEPAGSVSLSVSSGLFNVLLGDTSLGGMTQPLAAGVFAGADRALRVWFSSDDVTFTHMTPDRRIAAAPYALQAQEAASAASAGDADTLDGMHASEVVAGSAWTLVGNAGTGPADFIGTTDAQPLVLRTNNAERLRVDAEGRLGVGTASPSEMLTVDGNARVLNNDNPVLRGTASAGAGSGPKTVAAAGQYAYVTSFNGNLLSIYDISDPGSMLLLGSTSTNLDWPASVAVAGRYAYVASQNNDLLAVFDVSAPNNIVAKGTTGSGLDGPMSVAVAGRYAYVASYNNSTLAAFDVSDPGSIVAMGTTSTNLSGPNSVTIAGRYAFVTSENNDSLSIFDVSNPSSIVAKGTTSTNLNGPMSVAVAGRYAYVASFLGNSLAVFDVSDPGSILFKGATSTNIDTPRWVAVAGGPRSTYAYVACDHLWSLAVFDVSDPTAIVAKGTVATSNGPYSVALSGRYAYVVQWDQVLAAFELSHLEAPTASIGSLRAGGLQVGESAVVGHSLDVLGSLNVGQGALFDGPVAAASLSVGGNPVWHAGNDGAASGLDADLLDGSHASAFSLSGHNHDAAYVNEGQANSVTSSMLQDGATLAEILDDDGAGSTLDADLLDGSHASAFSLSGHNHDASYVNEGQADSITSSMILNGTLALADIGQNGCTSGQVMQWNGSAWACAAAGTTDHGALTGLGDDDHTQYFALSQNETVTGVPAFNGGTSGSSAPFSADSNTLVTNLNADLLDGQHSSYFSPTTHTHANLTPGTGLSGTAYNGGAPVSNWAVVYGTAAGSAVQGNQAATISAGSGLTGGVSGDALGDGFSATLNVAGGNGISAAADALNLGPFTADWSQTGAFDLLLNNAGSELRILESAGATYFGTFDVGDLGANQTYTFGTGGTVWTSGNDGTGSTLDADLLDGQHSTYFSPTTHTHDTVYWMQNGNSFGAVGRLGTNDNYALELEVNNNRALRIEPDFDSPNLIGGDDVNAVTSGAHGAVIAGGGYTSSYPNKVQDHFGVVGGGYNNRAGDSSDGDVADDPGATIGGGINNVAGAADSTVSGGLNNSATGLAATIAGGAYNTASGDEAMIAGGMSNTAAGAYSFAAGRRAKASADGCFVWGDSTNADVTCSTANQFVARASGGVSFAGSNSFTINGNTAWHAGNDGAGSGLDADTVDGAHGPFFAQGGNVFGATARLGTNDNYALELEVNAIRALRLEPDATSPNLVGGYSGNSVTGAYGATVSGGGASGAANSVTANFGTVPGGRAATASHYGEMAQAAGAFAAPGDAQASTYVLRNSTSDGTTWVPLYLDGSAAKLTLAAGRSMTFDILITAMASNGAAASYQYVGGIKRLSTGQITLLGGPAELLVREDEAGWEVSIGADTSSNALDVVCRGAAGRTIHWVAVVRTVETAMP